MHILILGAGEIGQHLALSLSRENRNVILIEGDVGRADQLDAEDNDLEILRGNAADPAVLLAAGLQRADLLVAVTNSDEINIAACAFAARLAPGVRRVARIRHLDTRVHGRLLTEDPPLIHSIINPEELCARKIADLVLHPGASDVNWFLDARAVLVGLPVTAQSPVAGKSLLTVGREREEAGLPFLIATVLHEQEARVPAAADVLRSGDTLYVATETSRLGETLRYFAGAGRLEPMRSVTIYGGGNIGLYLAQMLEGPERSIKLIEPDEARAAFLADQLSDTLVLCGDLSDKNLFDEEQIAASDAFVAVTGDQEGNMIAALYAKSYGIRLAAAALYRTYLAPLVNRLGIDALVFPQQAAIGEILEHVRAGQVSSVLVLEQQGMEVIEALVPETSRLAHRTLRQVRMPQGALLLAIQRRDGRIEIPHGGTALEPGDRMAVISRQRDMDDIARLLAGARGWT